MPDKPTPEQDPITSKSYAAHYMIATIILVITLFWALWDEAWGQRPWKAFQETWKDRYSAFLNTARSKSQASEKDVEKDSQYADLAAAVKKASDDSAAAAKAAREKLDDASARLLAVQSVFTDRRAYVNALTYELETSESESSKKSKAAEIKDYKGKKATVEFPDGTKKEFDFEELEKTYNEIRDERTKLSLELGDVLKPVTAAKAKLDEYVSDHMVDLTPAQIDGLRKKTSDWDPTIVQINVAEANIVDRCESCHMGAREPLKITPASMMSKGEKKPDEYATAFVSHPEPEILRFTIPTSSAAPRVTRAMDAPPPASRRLTATTSTGSGRSIPKKTRRPDARAAIPATWSLPAATCSLKPSTPAKIFSASADATAATATKATTKSPKT